MPTRIRKSKPTQDSVREDAVADVPATDADEREKRLAEIDSMLDEVDEVLEENAEEFVAAYIQKGGE